VIYKNTELTTPMNKPEATLMRGSPGKNHRGGGNEKMELMARGKEKTKGRTKKGLGSKQSQGPKRKDKG